MALETNGKEENVIQQCWSASEEHFFAPGKPQNALIFNKAVIL